jgi:hypothetical protein
MSESESLAIIGYFEREQMKKKLDSKEKKYPLFRTNELVLTHSFISLACDDSSEPKLGAVNFFHSSSWLITSDESTLAIHPDMECEQCKSAFTFLIFITSSK